jgi:hypothetical protein
MTLALADPEHLGTALWTSTLCSRLAVLHFDGLRIAHLPLSAALHTVCLHLLPP